MLVAIPCYAQLGGSTGLYKFKKFEDNPVQKSLVRIHAQHEQGTALGSGVVLGCDLILTANHVIEGADSVDIYLPYCNKTFKNVEVVKVDPDHDLAILRVKLPKTSKPLTVSKTTPKQGDVVQFLGFAGGSVPRHFECQVLSVDELGQRILLNAPVIQGDSGGTILNKDGEIVGCIQQGIVTLRRISHLELDEMRNPLMLALTSGHDNRAIAEFLKAYDE